MLREPHLSWSDLPGSRIAWGLVAGTWRPGHAGTWAGTLGSGRSSPCICVLTPSSKVQVEGESPQWVIVHHLLVLAVTQGKAVTGNLSPSRTTGKGEICNSRVLQTGHMFPEVASEGIN